MSSPRAMDLPHASHDERCAAEHCGGPGSGGSFSASNQNAEMNKAFVKEERAELDAEEGSAALPLACLQPPPGRWSLNDCLMTISKDLRERLSQLVHFQPPFFNFKTSEGAPLPMDPLCEWKALAAVTFTCASPEAYLKIKGKTEHQSGQPYKKKTSRQFCISVDSSFDPRYCRVGQEDKRNPYQIEWCSDEARQYFRGVRNAFEECLVRSDARKAGNQFVCLLAFLQSSVLSAEEAFEVLEYCYSSLAWNKGQPMSDETTTEDQTKPDETKMDNPRKASWHEESQPFFPPEEPGLFPPTESDITADLLNIYSQSSFDQTEEPENNPRQATDPSSGFVNVCVYHDEDEYDMRTDDGFD